MIFVMESMKIFSNQIVFVKKVRRHSINRGTAPHSSIKELDFKLDVIVLFSIVMFNVNSSSFVYRKILFIDERLTKTMFSISSD